MATDGTDDTMRREPQSDRRGHVGRRRHGQVISTEESPSGYVVSGGPTASSTPVSERLDQQVPPISQVSPDTREIPARSDAPWRRIQASNLNVAQGISSSGVLSGIELGEAIEALCHALDRSWREAQDSGLFFAVEPIELKAHIAPVRIGPEPDGVEWIVVGIDEQVITQASSAQTLTLRFTARPDEQDRSDSDQDQSVTDE